MRLTYLSREEFLGHYWNYELGEHVGIWEPTGQGKTHLAGQLLEVTLPKFENIRFASLMPKPKDPATRYWADRIGLKITDRWPPPPRWPWENKPPGYVLWPRHLANADKKTARLHLAAKFRPCLSEQYWKGHSITLCDDVYLAAVLLGLNMDLEEFWVSGQAMGAGLWAPNQKPSGTVHGGAVSSFSYNSPTHLFFGHDPDMRNQHRYSEIGGVDPRLVADQVARLEIHQVKTPHGVKNISEKLYIHKGGPWMCVIGL